jgi:hypothetical protein
MNPALVIVVLVAFVALGAFITWMRSPGGPMKKYRRDYREQHADDDGK